MRFLVLLLLLPNICFAAASNVFTSPRENVRLISQTNVAGQGRILLGLQFQLTPGWHIYWSNPGDAGLAPQIILDAPASAGGFSFPPPQLLMQGPVAAYVLSGDVLLPFTADHVGNRVSANATWLVCSDVCVPERARFTLALAGGTSAEAGLFKPPLVVPSPFAARIAPDGSLTVAGLTPEQVRTARFFPNLPGIIVNAAPQTLRFEPQGMTLKLSTVTGFDAKQNLTGILEMTDPSGAMQALQLLALPGAAPAGPRLMLWLAFAFLGGLLLNLMPCVFPVLAMKALALARLGGAARPEIRREALGYTAGVLAAMLALGGVLIGLRASSSAIGWGFQFQSPVFVALTGWLILALGLNLAGVFEISLPARFSRLLARRGSFFTGLLAVLTATPCTAPFMGGAVAAALIAPLAAAFGIFLFLGLGLAAPFLLLALAPRLAGVLPRPGQWMVTLQRFLSLPMFATFVWLAWVMAREAGSAGLLLLCLGAISLALALTVKSLRVAALPALLVLPFLHNANAPVALTLPGAAPYSAARLATLRAAGTPVFIDLTAAWCVTCLVNDRTTLTTQQVQAGFARAGVKLLVGDWTRRDPQISLLLRENNRDGVPLYLYYPANAEPVTLPQILTPQIVLDTIKK